tara:strand:- start:81 stop:1865 length:1785 start_codon:yes stop_codon:yes gene_type:complete
MGARCGARTLLRDPTFAHASELFEIGDDAFFNHAPNRGRGAVVFELPLSTTTTLAADTAASQEAASQEKEAANATGAAGATRLRNVRIGDGATVAHSVVVGGAGDGDVRVGEMAVVLNGACCLGPVADGVVAHGAPPTHSHWSRDVAAERAKLRAARPARGCYAAANGCLVFIALAAFPALVLCAGISAWDLTMSAQSKWSARLTVGACNTAAYRELAALPTASVRAQLRSAYVGAGCSSNDTSAFPACVRGAALETAEAVAARVDEGWGGQPAGVAQVCRSSRSCAHFDDTPDADALPDCWEDELPRLNCSLRGKQALASLDAAAFEAALLSRDDRRRGGNATDDDDDDDDDARLELRECGDLLLDACRRDQLTATLRIGDDAASYPPRGTRVAPRACGEEVLQQLFVQLSWRRPLRLLELFARLQLFYLVQIATLLALVLLVFRLLGGRFRPGTTTLFDVRSGDILRLAFGYPSDFLHRNAFSAMPYGINGSQLLVGLCRLEGMRIGRRVFVDRDVDLQDGELITIGDDAVVGTSASIVGHDLVVGCHQMLRNAVHVPAACRVGEAARLGAGTVVTRTELPPLYSTVSNERA